MDKACAVEQADSVRRVKLCASELRELGASAVGNERVSAILTDAGGQVCGRVVRRPDPCSGAWNNMSWHVSLGGPTCGLAWCCVASFAAADTLPEAVMLAVSGMRERAAQFERAADVLRRMCHA